MRKLRCWADLLAIAGFAHWTQCACIANMGIHIDGDPRTEADVRFLLLNPIVEGEGFVHTITIQDMNE